MPTGDAPGRPGRGEYRLSRGRAVKSACAAPKDRGALEPPSLALRTRRRGAAVAHWWRLTAASVPHQRLHEQDAIQQQAGCKLRQQNRVALRQREGGEDARRVAARAERGRDRAPTAARARDLTPRMTTRE